MRIKIPKRRRAVFDKEVLTMTGKIALHTPAINIEIKSTFLHPNFKLCSLKLKKKYNLKNKII